MKIAFFDTKEYDKDAFYEYNGKDGIEIKFYETKLCEDTVELARGYDVVCIFVNDTADAPVIERLHEMGVRLIALRCAGYNNVDLRAARGKIRIVRVPAYSPYAVAEHAWAMMLCSVRRIHKSYIRTKGFNFSLNGLTGYDFHGKTVGVIGTGKIGRVFIDICRGFGMKILAYDKYPSEIKNVEYTDLDTLFRASDIISLHCPLTDESYHMINKESLSCMKEGVLIVNTSRGALIDAQDLLTAIKDRRIGGACLDVYEEESDIFFEDYSAHIVDDDTLARLITMPNVIVTSHQAFLTEEALSNIAYTTVNNITSFFKTGSAENEVCYKCKNN